MKTLQILAAGAIALGLADVASAQTVIRFTGSTAFRSQTITAILKVLGAADGITLPAGSRYGFTGTSRTGATAMYVVGSFGGQPVIVKTSFSGSNAGIQVTAGSQNVNFQPSTVDDGTLTTTGKTNLAAASLAEIPDVAMMDTTQDATPFNGTYLGQSYASLTSTVVGVIPYKWVATGNAPVTMTTMTPLLAQAQWIGLGTLPLALYTASPTDRSTLVYATGRNAGSGTRNAAFTESGVGATTLIQQFDPANGNLYPAATVNGISYGLGEGGENSGGTVATKLRTSAIGSRVYVSYLGINDADTALGATTGSNPGTPCKELAWNGVTYSKEAVIDGRYTFWTYQNLGYRSNYAGVGKSFADAVAAQIVNETSPILLSEMQVTRPLDGAVVTPTY